MVHYKCIFSCRSFKRSSCPCLFQSSKITRKWGVFSASQIAKRPRQWWKLSCMWIIHLFWAQVKTIYSTYGNLRRWILLFFDHAPATERPGRRGSWSLPVVCHRSRSRWMTEWVTPSRLPISRRAIPSWIHARALPLSASLSLRRGGMVKEE